MEADDFDPPQVKSVVWDTESGDLRIQVRDPAGVACVRVAYTYQDQRCVQDLDLAAGDVQAGEWRVPFPVGAAIKGGEITVGDELFNTSELAVAW